MRKGITPVIATILLLTITVAIAGVAWTYLNGFIISGISTTFEIPPEFAYCVRGQPPATGGMIKVFIQNTAYQTILVTGGPAPCGTSNLPGHFTYAQLDGADILSYLTCIPVPQGEAGLLLDYTCDPANPTDPTNAKCTSGYHQLEFATSSKNQRVSVFCP